jgi:hypothetical protein
MKSFKATFARILTAENGVYEITFCTKNKNVLELKAQGEKPLVVDVKVYKEKRSTDANAYFWTLADKLAVELSKGSDKPMSKTDIYREYIKDIGAFFIYPIPEKSVEQYKKIWEHQGLGWIVEDTGSSKIGGYHNLLCYYGSSVYDTTQMSKLIDLVIADCKENGIETKTPNEIAEMKSRWAQ